MAFTGITDEKGRNTLSVNDNGKKQLNSKSNNDAVTTRSMGFRNIKAASMKGKADKAFAAKNYRDAYEAYTQAIDCAHDLNMRLKLLSNRALAYTKAGRFHSALEDSKSVVEMAPSWSKGHFRLGAAYLGLRQFRDAAASFASSLRLEPGAQDIRRSLWKAVLKLTKEELADIVLDEIDHAVEEKMLTPPTHQVVKRAVLHEAMYLIIREAHGRQTPKNSLWDIPITEGNLILESSLGGTYSPKFYVYVFSWFETTPSPILLYTLRSRAFCRAKAFRQATVDSEQAMKLAIASDIEIHPYDLAHLHCTLGDAYGTVEEREEVSDGRRMIVPVNDREFCDWGRALFHFAKATALDPNQPLYDEKWQTAKDNCDPYICSKIMNMIFEDNISLLQKPVEAESHPAEELSSKPHSCLRYFMDLMYSFPRGLSSWLNAALRQKLIHAISLVLDLPSSKVTIEHVRSHRPEGVDIHCTATFRGDSNRAAKALERLQSSGLFFHETGCRIRNDDENELVKALGPADERKFHAILKSKTEGIYTLLKGNGLQQQRKSQTEEISIVTPVLELYVPYESYKLVKSDGSPVERAEKHPFQMTRVFYDKRQLTDSIWVEAAEASYRWRQSASEVHIICLNVPKDIPNRDVFVSIDSHHIIVKHKETGQVYLHGNLWRGIIPEESFWVNGNGDGEDGFIIQLTKMNLELHTESWEHSHTWWEKLFMTESYRIQWDDYDKDYSDLPSEILEAHNLIEAKKEISHMLDYGEKQRKHRENFAEEVRLQDRHLRLIRLGVPHWTPTHEDITKGIRECRPRWIGLQDACRLAGLQGLNDPNSNRGIPDSGIEIQNKVIYDLVLERRSNLDKALGLEEEDGTQRCYRRAFMLIHATYSVFTFVTICVQCRIDDTSFK